MVKNLSASAGELTDVGSIPGSGRPPGGGHGKPLQCSCLENPMDRGAWQVTGHGVAESTEQLTLRYWGPTDGEQVQDQRHHS